MAKRKKVIQAGNLVMAAIYTPPQPRDAEHVRVAKSKATTEARRLMNMKVARRRLEMLLAANFGPQDMHLTLTYRPKDLPTDRKAALKCIRRFISQMRAYRRARGNEFKYIYVTEGQHGDKRLHHHIVINSVSSNDVDIIRSLWPYGDQVDAEAIADREFEGLAAYITKETLEAGKPNGAQMWTGSRNLAKPITTIAWVGDDETLAPPAGSYVLERREAQTEFSSYAFIKYRFMPPAHRKSRPSRAKTIEHRLII